jgi:hypothetical protein
MVNRSDIATSQVHFSSPSHSKATFTSSPKRPSRLLQCDQAFFQRATNIQPMRWLVGSNSQINKSGYLLSAQVDRNSISREIFTSKRTTVSRALFFGCKQSRLRKFRAYAKSSHLRTAAYRLASPDSLRRSPVTPRIRSQPTSRTPSQRTDPTTRCATSLGANAVKAQDVGRSQRQMAHARDLAAVSLIYACRAGPQEPRHARHRRQASWVARQRYCVMRAARHASMAC